VGLAAPDVARAQEALEEVVVTGSRIRQDPLEERLPVLTLATEDIRLTGTSSLADFIQRLPISGSAINATNNSSGNLGFPPDGGGIGAGAAEIDLRYLTSKRVLVLVDGRRWIKGSSGSGVSGAVDLNTIPVNAVKTIEILQDGASAVYGSDAIGGVLNIITQDDYDSFKISGYTGQYQQGDGTTSEFDVRFGARGERTRGLIDISYTDQGSVNTADRDTSKYPIPGFPFGISSGTPAGRFVFLDPVIGDFVSVAPDDGVAFPVWDPTDDPAQPFNHLVTPNERVNIFAKAEYDVTDNVMFRVLGSFNNRKSQGQAAPVPLFFFPDGQSTTYMVSVSWPADHPYNPFGVDLEPSGEPFMARRPIEAGPRIFNQDVDTWYVSGGFDGEFELGGRAMYWDISGIRAENDATQIKLNQFNARNINIAMGDPDVCAVTPNCVPLNIVGAGSMTQEMLDYVTYTGVDRSNQKLTDFTANLAGELFDLPAGPLGFAVGYEYREEEGFFTPDPVVAADETADVPTTPTVGSFDVSEFYGEIVVPLLADLPLADSLDLSAAVRVSDYNLFDSETVTKFAVNWGPTDNLVFRASFSEGFRAPNIGELFNQGSRFDASISDRCSNVQPEDAANCAALGVPPDYEQLNPQIPVTTGGNAELVPETSDTVSVGFTWQVPVNGAAGMDDLLVEVNYYDIDIEGAIQAPRPQGLLDACITTLEDIYCDAITRLPSGTILRVDGVLDNDRSRHLPLPVDDLVPAQVRRAGPEFLGRLRQARSERPRARLADPRLPGDQVDTEYRLDVRRLVGSSRSALHELDHRTVQRRGRGFRTGTVHGDQRARRRVLRRHAGQLAAVDIHGRWLDFLAGRQQLVRRGSAHLLLVQPEQPRRDALSDRRPVLVRPGDLREVAFGHHYGYVAVSSRPAPERGPVCFRHASSCDDHLGRSG